MANHFVKHLYNFLEPAWNNYSKNTGLVDFLPILCSLYISIMNVISLFGSRSPCGAVWEGKIPFEIGHIKDMEINTSNSYFGLSSWFFKVWTRSSHRMWKTRLQTLCIILETQFGIIIPKIQNLYFVSQTTHWRFSPYYMHLFQPPYVGRTLVALWEVNMLFE